MKRKFSTGKQHQYSLPSSELIGIESDYVTSETLETWMNTLKKEHKIKGKPLFMESEFV